MNLLTEMHHYVTICQDGTYHVQNMAGTMLGQHHVHDRQGYEIWFNNPRIDKEHVHKTEGDCKCGLKAGETMQG